uniref:HMG box domain-containing protein n=1 Tax=Trichuris muris TaxID=70415 RepID=A0A5S6QLY3_TRIMR
MEQDIDLIDALLKRAKDRRRLDLPSDFPKKPISAYNIFLSKVIKNGSLLEYDSKDRFVQAARIWKGLDPAKKEKFFKKYRLAVEKHDVQMEEFKAAHPELNIRPTPKSKRKLDAKTVRNEQQPSTSHPSTSKHVDLHEASFQCFALAKQDKYAEKYNLRGEDLMKKLRRKFDRMSADKQQKWHDFVTKENCIDCPMSSIKRDGAA